MSSCQKVIVNTTYKFNAVLKKQSDKHDRYCGKFIYGTLIICSWIFGEKQHLTIPSLHILQICLRPNFSYFKKWKQS